MAGQPSVLELEALPLSDQALADVLAALYRRRLPSETLRVEIAYLRALLRRLQAALDPAA